MLKRISLLIAVFAVFSCLWVFPTLAAPGRNEIVINADTGEIYASSNAHARMPMASTTKVVTALVAIENSNVNDLITVDAKSCGIEGSSIYLKEGEQLTVLQLLYGLMLQSGNDCAMALARNAMSGYEAFIAAMNAKAAELGLKDSHFVNPHGLHDDAHYTSCYDLAMLTRAAMSNAVFRRVVSTKSIQIGQRHLVNKNKMLREFEGGNGVKTGFTKRAGRCLVSSATRGNLTLVTVVLNCGDMWERSKALMEGVFSRYEHRTFFEAGKAMNVTLFGSDQKVRVTTKNSLVRSIEKKDVDNYRTEIVFYKKLIPPLKKGENIGEFHLYYENRLIFSEKIYTMDDVVSYSEYF